MQILKFQATFCSPFCTSCLTPDNLVDLVGGAALVKFMRKVNHLYITPVTLKLLKPHDEQLGH